MLTAYCSIEDVPHVELNGHILVPLQNVASLHCSSRCDAPAARLAAARARGARPRRRPSRRRGRRRLTAAACAARPHATSSRPGSSSGCSRRPSRGVGWLLADARGAVLFAFCSLLAATAAYAVGDRALLGMLGARPFALAEDPLLRSTADRIAAQLQIAPPKLQLLDDTLPAGVRRRTRAARRDSRGQRRPSDGAPPARDRGGDRARAGARPHARRAHPDATPSSSRRRSSSSAGSADSSRGSCSPCSRRSARRSRTCCSRRSASCAPTRSPPGIVDPHDLADALIRLDRAAELVEFHASPATEPLYTVSPFDHTERVARMFVTHPPSPTGSSRLRALAEDGDAARGGRRPALPAGRPGEGRCGAQRRGGRRSAGAHGFPHEKTGGILLSRGLAPQVPSARAGLTSLFGMGRGISPSL